MKYILICLFICTVNAAVAQDPWTKPKLEFILKPDPRLKNVMILPETTAPVAPFKKKLGPGPNQITIEPGYEVFDIPDMPLRGIVIDSTEGFVIQRLPLDGMPCLVPDRNNPAMAIQMNMAPATLNGAPIPNPFFHQKRLFK